MNQQRFFTLLILAALTALVVSGCTSVEGSGDVTSQTPQLPPFDRVFVGGIVNATIEQGETDALTITADDNLFENITAEVQDGQLRLDTRDVANPTQLTFRVTVHDLKAVEVIDLADVEVQDVKTERLEVTLDEMGTVTARGDVETLDVNASGSAEFDGTGLVSASAQVRARGMSEVVVNAQDSAQFWAEDSANVQQVGEGSVERNVLD